MLSWGNKFVYNSNCPSDSSSQSPALSESPSKSPTEYCKDNASFHLSVSYQNCAWVGVESADACEDDDVFMNCRATCDPGCYCTNSDDAYDELIVTLLSPPYLPTGNPEFRNCNWVRDHFSEDICDNIEAVYFGCRDVCDQTCY